MFTGFKGIISEEKPTQFEGTAHGNILFDD
jgi:hypothetical protein